MVLSMRRMVLLVAVVAVMAAMLAASAVPASAGIACTTEIDWATGEKTRICYDYDY